MDEEEGTIGFLCSVSGETNDNGALDGMDKFETHPPLFGSQPKIQRQDQGILHPSTLYTGHRQTSSPISWSIILQLVGLPAEHIGCTA